MLYIVLGQCSLLETMHFLTMGTILELAFRRVVCGIVVGTWS